MAFIDASTQRGVPVLEDPLVNRGTAFSPHERRDLGPDGLIPLAVERLRDASAHVAGAVREGVAPAASDDELRAHVAAGQWAPAYGR